MPPDCEVCRRPVQDVLDVGCGTGKHLIPLVRDGLRLTGVDYSEAMVRECRRKLDRRGLDAELRAESLLELDVTLAPVKVGRDQLVDVGVDGKMARGIDARRNGKHERKDQDERSEARTGLYNRDNNIRQHIVSFW